MAGGIYRRCINNPIILFTLLFYCNLQDSWEDDENEKNQAATPAPAVVSFSSFSISLFTNICCFPVQPAKKKALKKLEEKIAEKERKAKEEAEQKRLMREENMTPEEKLADKLYRQKLVEESDFEMARETFGSFPAQNQNKSCANSKFNHRSEQSKFQSRGQY